MKEKKERMIIENGNEVYEIDMECMRNRQRRSGRVVQNSQKKQKQNKAGKPM